MIDVFEDQEARVGDEDDHHFVLAVDEAQDAALEHEAEHEPDRHRHQDHEQEAAGVRQPAVEVDADRGRRAVGAEGIERAMRHVEDLHHAEDQREADRDQEQVGRVDQAIGQDREGGQHGGPHTLRDRMGLRRIAPSP